MKLVEKNDELEEENEKQEQSLQNQEKFLISKLQELKAINERYEKLSIEHALVTNSSSSVSQLEKENFELKAKLDELSSKYNVLQANYVHLKCSHEELVESSIMLEVAHEVVITTVKSSQPPTHTLTCTQSQLNISCANECASQASQSSIEQKIIENIELKEEVKRLKKDVIRLKGKEKAQPSQDNRDNMVKKLEKGSNLASFKTQQRNHISSKANTTKSKKHGKSMCYGCGLYGHEWATCPHKNWADKVEAATQKASIKEAKQVKSDGQSAYLISKKLGHPTKKCPIYQESRKVAQVATRRCYGCNEMGHKVDGCPYKQNKHRANKGRICYACGRKGHLSYDCPNGNIPKPNTFVYDNMLRKTTNGMSTSKVMCSPQTSTKAIWVPKHLLTNPKGPNKSWVPKCA
jgi:myosin heavy subunit